MNEPLIHIFYQDPLDAPTIHEYIESIDRLNELVSVQQSDELQHGVPYTIYVNERRIYILPDWLDQRPAFVFPSEIPLNRNFLLGAIFGLLGNEEKYPQYFTGFPLMLHLFDLMQAITGAKECDQLLEQLLHQNAFNNPFQNYAFNHNVAIALNFGHYSQELNPDAIEAHYIDAMQLAFEPAYKAYTAKYYATFLLDIGRTQAAIHLLNDLRYLTDSLYPRFALEKAWCEASIRNLIHAPGESSLTELKERIWNTLTFYDTAGHTISASTLWMQAALIANQSNSYAEALGYINKAITNLRLAEQPELTAQAQLTKGRILFDWAQSGNPQFYRNALEAFGEALKVFGKEDAPEVFADIHHQLGVIYAALPDDQKKRAIWAALSATSFNEALEFFNKHDYPEEFGMICNNYANSYLTYPQGNRTNNMEKALDYYRESLSVRAAETYPEERALTLLNFLDASWSVGNPEEGFNNARFQDMLDKVAEVEQLTHDPQLLAEAARHKKLLDVLALKNREEVQALNNA